jgi:hypothetical protein
MEHEAYNLSVRKEIDQYKAEIETLRAIRANLEKMNPTIEVSPNLFKTIPDS